jgi:hypothetical protein
MKVIHKRVKAYRCMTDKPHKTLCGVHDYEYKHQWRYVTCPKCLELYPKVYKYESTYVPKEKDIKPVEVNLDKFLNWKKEKDRC